MNRWSVLALLVAIMLVTASAATASDGAGAPWGDEEEKPGLGPKAFVEEMLQQRATIMAWERIRVRGQAFDSDLPPVIMMGRVLIPVRAVTQGLGADVVWDPDENTVTITRGDIEIVFVIGDTFFTVNGVEHEFDVPAQVLSNRTFVPLRFIASALGERVDYCATTGNVTIGNEDEEEEEDEDGEGNPGQGRGTSGV